VNVGVSGSVSKVTGRRFQTLAWMVAFFATALVTNASAGEYHVYSCRTPVGESAPTDGWSGAAGPTYSDYAKDTCGEGGALTAALGDVTIHKADLDLATWTFNTPAYASMVGATLWRAGDAAGGAGFNATYELWLAGPSNGEVFGSCVYVAGCTGGVGQSAEPLAAGNRVVVPAADLGAHLYLNAACEGTAGFECPGGSGDAEGYAAAVNLYAADIVLAQSAGPTATNVSGELASAATVSGVSDVTFSASDPGAGVWETTFSVDGKVVQSTVPDENGGRCLDVGETTDGLPAFLYLQPCLPAESVDVPFNTTVVGNGVHHLVVGVLDPAGNSAPVLDRKIDVENPVPGHTGAGAAKPVVKRTLTRARLTLRVAPRRVGANQRVFFSGRLLGGSIPKGGKRLVVEGRRSRRGPWQKFDLIRTGAQGRFHAGYRFTFLGPGDWEIRVLCEAEMGYPFATGWSNIRGVRVVARGRRG
jgi:hypothetical protein